MVDFNVKYKNAIAAAKSKLAQKKIQDERLKEKAMDSNVVVLIEKAIAGIEKAVLAGDDRILVAQSTDSNIINKISFKLKANNIPHEVIEPDPDTDSDSMFSVFLKLA